jgi:hypothetical protein
MTTNGTSHGTAGRMAIGAALVLLGAAWMVAEFVSVDLSDWWPAFILVPGLAVVAWGLALRGGGRTAALVVGFQMAGVGGVLWIQNALDLWTTWAYAWALLWPGAVGAAIWLAGRLNGDPTEAMNGRRVMNVGLIMFGIGFVFFEGLVGISGDAVPFAGTLVPVILILLGVLLLVPGIRKGSRTPE